MKINPIPRQVYYAHQIVITDDYGDVMSIGDQVEIHVMPYDYFTTGELLFSEESCAFYLKTKLSKFSLSHYGEDYDMGATIPISMTFRKITEVKDNV